MNLLSAALTWHNADCSVIPIRYDGTKRPAVEWKQYQQEQAPACDLQGWWGGQPSLGIGIVCGEVSGNLEMLELEGRAASSEDLSKIEAQCVARGVDWLLHLLMYEGYCEWTPSGGLHFLYRISDHLVPGNTKVARRPATAQELLANPDDRVKVLSETRGEGGYVIVAPTGGKVHPSGDSWSLAAGELGVVPTVSWADRCLLLEAITAALDEMPQVELPARRTLPQLPGAGLRPGDDFNARADWRDILEPHGWHVAELRGNETFWIRPGKKFEGRGSHSATTGFKGDGDQDRLYVFSTSTTFDTETPYSKFAAYTLLEHQGNFTAATKELARQGYGSQGPRPSYQATPMQAPVASTIMVPAPVTEAVPVVVVPAEPVIQLSGSLPAVPERVLQNRDWDDQGASEMFAEVFGKTLRYVSDEKAWRKWDHGRWAEGCSGDAEWAMQGLATAAKQHGRKLKDDEHPGAAAFQKFTQRMSGMKLLRGIPQLAASNPMIASRSSDYDTQRHLVTVNNGVVNLNTMQLQPHDPSLLLTKKLNTSYDPGKGTGRWGTFMEEVLPNPQVRGYLQRALGYALTGEANQRAIFLLHGNSGTGKSQVVEAMAKVFGDFASGISAGALLPKRQAGPGDDVHKLRGTRMAFISELNQNAVLNESLIKSATGGDTLTTRALYGDFVSWRPEFVIFMATNYLPRVSSTDDAIWRRVKPIKFEQCFVDDDGSPLHADGADKGVRIATEDPECVLNWLLEGLAAYRERGLGAPAEVQAWTQDYRDEVDTVRQFITEGQVEGRLKLEDKLETGSRDLYKAYVAWCADAQQHPVSLRHFGQLMESSKFERVRQGRGVMWQGIGLLGFMVEAQTPAVRSSWTSPMRM